MLDNGGNVAALTRALAYVIEDRGSGARVEWSDESVATTIEEALRPKAIPSLVGQQADERLECDGWLRGLLTEGVKSTIEVFRAGNAAGFSKDQIRRAKFRIGAVARREGYGVNGQLLTLAIILQVPDQFAQRPSGRSSRIARKTIPAT
jgi:hypothetical protein